MPGQTCLLRAFRVTSARLPQFPSCAFRVLVLALGPILPLARSHPFVTSPGPSTCLRRPVSSAHRVGSSCQVSLEIRNTKPNMAFRTPGAQKKPKACQLKSGGLGSCDAAGDARHSSNSKAVSACAGQQYSAVCQPQHSQAATCHKVLGTAQLLGCKRTVLWLSQGNMPDAK